MIVCDRVLPMILIACLGEVAPSLILITSVFGPSYGGWLRLVVEPFCCFGPGVAAPSQNLKAGDPGVAESIRSEVFFF